MTASTFLNALHAPRPPARISTDSRPPARSVSLLGHTPHDLASEALRLPEEERLALASELIHSVEGRADPAWEKAWLDELNRRKSHGTEDALPWREVRARILRRLAGA